MSASVLLISICSQVFERSATARNPAVWEKPAFSLGRKTLIDSLLASFVVLAASVSVHAADQFTQRFGSDLMNPRILGYVGRDASRGMTRSDAGLLVKLPNDQSGGATQAGVATKFHVEGDFEITASYELLHVEKAEKGYGAGVVLRLPRADGSSVATQTHAGLARRKLSNGKDVFTTFFRTYVGGERQDEQKIFDAKLDRGKLRVVRTGPTLQFLIAEGKDRQFRELNKVEFGTEPVKCVQIVADTGGSAEPMTVRLIDLSIRAEELSIGLPFALSHSIWGLWSILSLVGVGVLVGAGYWYWRENGRRDHTGLK